MCQRFFTSKTATLLSGCVLDSVPSTASALLPLSAFGLVALRRGVVATLSATACTQELGTQIIVAHITRAVRAVRITIGRIAVHHNFYFLSFGEVFLSLSVCIISQFVLLVNIFFELA